MPVLSKPCIFQGSCPGDLGVTEVLWLGRQLCVSKASNIIKVFGSLETALSYINAAAVKCDAQRRCLWRVYWAVQYLGFYLSTGAGKYLRRSIYMLKKSLKCLSALASDKPVGWVLCLDECCAYINNARVWVRWVERRLAAVEEGREAILILNHVGSVLFELMRTRPHNVWTGGRLVAALPSDGDWSMPSWW